MILVKESMGNAEVDVLVIGAGVAGLSAAQALNNTGYSVYLVEAAHRIGGRAYSERLPNSAWFDLGCSYLHEGDINPFVEIAGQLGCMLGDGRRFENAGRRIFGGGGLDLRLGASFRANAGAACRMVASLLPRARFPLGLQSSQRRFEQAPLGGRRTSRGGWDGHGHVSNGR